MKHNARVWLARLLVALVLISNLYASIAFLIDPRAFVAGYELSGQPGRVAVMGVGLLFLMWQVPYFFALMHPLKQRTSLLQATLMQAIGLAGETAILQTIPGEHAVLRGSILRFIYFDAAGLCLLVFALLLVNKLTLIQED